MNSNVREPKGPLDRISGIFLRVCMSCQAQEVGSFVVHSFTELALGKLRAGGSTTTDGPFLWQPSLVDGRPATFLGYPIYANGQMGTLEGTGEV